MTGVGNLRISVKVYFENLSTCQKLFKSDGVAFPRRDIGSVESS